MIIWGQAAAESSVLINCRVQQNAGVRSMRLAVAARDGASHGQTQKASVTDGPRGGRAGPSFTTPHPVIRVRASYLSS